MDNQRLPSDAEAHTGTVTDDVDDDQVMNSTHSPDAADSLMGIRPRMDDAYSNQEPVPVGIVPKRTIEVPSGSDGNAG